MKSLSAIIVSMVIATGPCVSYAEPTKSAIERAAEVSKNWHPTPAKPIKTRHGILTSNEDGYLSFNGKIIQPTVFYDGSVAYSPVATFKLAKSDVILFLQAAGTSCDSNYAYVTVTAKSAVATENFGTCYGDEGISPVLKDGKITFTLTNLGGHGSSTYTYEGGKVFENGKQIKR